MSTQKHALTVIASPELRAPAAEIDQLKEAAIAQCAAITDLEGKAAIGGILAGMTLHRVKASLKHGEFGPWLNQISTSGGNLKIKHSQASNYMRLALVFIEKADAQKFEMMALTGGGELLDLTETSQGQSLASKLQKFVGDSSLNELLVKYNIKGVTREGDEPADKTKVGVTKDFFADVAEHLDGWRKIVTSRESLMRLSPQQLDLLQQSVSDGYAQFRKLYAEARGKEAIEV
jgi:hypothetical protein